MRWILALTLTALTASGASALSEGQITQAQMQMHQRVNSAVDVYARSIGVESDLITYCRSQMFLDTRHQIDGSIPFGVDYSDVKDAGHLSVIIGIREEYEKNYLKICLAKAKSALSAPYR